MLFPPATGYSQSRSIPSKPYFSMNCTHDVANCLRDASVAAASEKPVDHVHPPTEMSVLRFGWLFLRIWSWWKFPCMLPGASPHESPAIILSVSAQVSPTAQPPLEMLANA